RPPPAPPEQNRVPSGPFCGTIRHAGGAGTALTQAAYTGRLLRMAEDALDNIVIVLNRTQDIVNIAGTVRAMMNMGLSRLRLVAPDLYDAYRIAGIAHGSEWLLERRSEEHTSELQSREKLVCRRLLEKKREIERE